MGQAGQPSGEGRISSWDDFHGIETDLVNAINADPRLALAAAANPLLAIESLGYEIDPKARQAIEDQFRFPPKVARQVGKLRRDVFKAVGREFDPAEDRDVRAVLTELGLEPGRRRFTYEPLWQARLRGRRGAPVPKPTRKETRLEKQAKAAARTSQRSQSTGSAQASQVEPAEDPLEPFRDKHPAIERLIELRRVEGSAPPLARPDVFAAIRDGELDLPVTRVRGVMREA